MISCANFINSFPKNWDVTPFFRVHGAEAVLPVDITHEAPKIATYDESSSNEALQDDVDALDEARDVALARSTQY
jgi:hypothetical protein